MSLPKPEQIQNFIEEKLKKRKKGEAVPLLNSDDLKIENESTEKCNNNRCSSDFKPTSNRLNGKLPSSGVSESDDANLASIDIAKNDFKKRHRSIASDADLDTDDSGEHRRRKENSTSGATNMRKNKKPKDSKSLLKGTEEQCTNYGGTVNLDCKGTLASYSPKENKSSRQAGSNLSNEHRKSQKPSFNNETTKKIFKKSKHHNEKEHCNSGNAVSKSHKHLEDSSNSDSADNFSRRNSMESEHCHDSSDERSERDEKKRKKAMRKLMYATGLSFIFMVGEIVGGYLANSLAVMTDASHLLTDVSSFMISILALKMASRPISKKMTFGWHRAEVIGALISVVAIWIVTGVLVYLAIVRLVTNDYVVNGRNMLITASLAVGFNIVMGLVLHEHSHFGGHSHGHSHGHGHDHNHDHEAGSNASGADEDSNDSGNVNVRAAFIHVIGDLLQSLGVLIAAFIIYFKPSYKIADPICTFLFSIFVLITTITILRDTVIIIMEGSPVNIEYNVVKDKLLEIEGVAAVHDLRIWSLTLNQTVMSAHLAINKYSDPNAILKRATRKLKALYDFHSLTIQVEFYSDDMNSCKKCQQT